MLQTVLVSYQEHLCGLNPKEFRSIKSSHKLSLHPSRCIVDGDLIWTYRLMSTSDKCEVANKMGLSIEEILSDFLQIERMSAVF